MGIGRYQVRFGFMSDEADERSEVTSNNYVYVEDNEHTPRFDQCVVKPKAICFIQWSGRTELGLMVIKVEAFLNGHNRNVQEDSLRYDNGDWLLMKRGGYHTLMDGDVILQAHGGSFIVLGKEEFEKIYSRVCDY